MVHLLAPVISVLSLSALTAPAAAQPSPQPEEHFGALGLDYPSFGARVVVPIVEQSFQMMQDGSHRWSFEGADGSGRWEEAAPAWAGGGVRGGFGYSSDQGPVAVSYVADKYGFQPSGNAIHPDIVRAVALQVARAKEEPEGMWDDNGFPVLGFRLGNYDDY